MTRAAILPEFTEAAAVRVRQRAVIVTSKIESARQSVSHVLLKSTQHGTIDKFTYVL